MNPIVKWTMVALLAAIAGGYFALMVWRADAFARVLLARGYAQQGFDEPGLTMRVRLLGLVGLALSFAGLVAALVRMVG